MAANNLLDFMLGQLDDQNEVQGILKRSALKKKFAQKDMLLARHDDQAQLNARQDKEQSRREKLQAAGQKRQEQQAKQQQQQEEQAAASAAQADAAALLQPPQRISPGAGGSLAQDASAAAQGIAGQVSGGRGVQQGGGKGAQLTPQQLAGQGQLPPSPAPAIQGDPGIPAQQGLRDVGTSTSRNQPLQLHGRGAVVGNLFLAMTGLDETFGNTITTTNEDFQPNAEAMEAAISGEIADRTTMLELGRSGARAGGKDAASKEMNRVLQRIRSRQNNRLSSLSRGQNAAFKGIVNNRMARNIRDEKIATRQFTASLMMNQVKNRVPAGVLMNAMQALGRGDLAGYTSRLAPIVNKFIREEEETRDLNRERTQAGINRDNAVSGDLRRRAIEDKVLRDIQIEDSKLRRDKSQIDFDKAKTEQDRAVAFRTTDGNWVHAVGGTMLSPNERMGDEALTRLGLDLKVNPQPSIMSGYTGQVLAEQGILRIPNAHTVEIPNGRPWVAKIGQDGLIAEDDFRNALNVVLTMEPLEPGVQPSPRQFAAAEVAHAAGYKINITYDNNGKPLAIRWKGHGDGKKTSEVSARDLVDPENVIGGFLISMYEGQKGVVAKMVASGLPAVSKAAITGKMRIEPDPSLTDVSPKGKAIIEKSRATKAGEFVRNSVFVPWEPGRSTHPDSVVRAADPASAARRAKSGKRATAAVNKLNDLDVRATGKVVRPVDDVVKDFVGGVTGTGGK